jgi:hypothetical protein
MNNLIGASLIPTGLFLALTLAPAGRAQHVMSSRQSLWSQRSQSPRTTITIRGKRQGTWLAQTAVPVSCLDSVLARA